MNRIPFVGAGEIPTCNTEPLLLKRTARGVIWRLDCNKEDNLGFLLSNNSVGTHQKWGTVISG